MLLEMERAAGAAQALEELAGGGRAGAVLLAPVVVSAGAVGVRSTEGIVDDSETPSQATPTTFKAIGTSAGTPNGISSGSGSGTGQTRSADGQVTTADYTDDTLFGHFDFTAVDQAIEANLDITTGQPLNWVDWESLLISTGAELR